MAIWFDRYPADARIAKFHKELDGLLDIETGPWVAGGSVAKLLLDEDLGPSDIDIFCANGEQRAKLMEEIGKRFKASRYKENCFNSASTVFQVVGEKFYSPNLPRLFKSFDFTVCEFATDLKKVAFTSEARRDLDSKTLRLIDGGLESKAPLLRLIKYTTRGYIPMPGLMEELIFKKNARFTDEMEVLHDY